MGVISGVFSRILQGVVLRHARGLRFPRLFLLMAGLFIVDLLLPDFIPFLDEILLGLGTLALAAWKRRKEDLE